MSDCGNKDLEDFTKIKSRVDLKTKSLVELPNENIKTEKSKPQNIRPERAKTSMKHKIPKLELEKMSSEPGTRIDFLAQTDLKKIQELELRKLEIEMAKCTFMPKTSRGKRGQTMVVTKDFVDKLAKPKTIEKYAKMKENRDLQECTFKPQ